jgi:hypothetical protein
MEKTSAPKKVGRPTMYSAELAERICQRIENGESERRIAMDDDMPSQSTMWRWKEEHPEFCKQSARAREVSAEKFNDELLELQENLNNELQTRLLSGDDFPKGTVEAFKVLMQEKARQISWRDDSRFGDRKTVKIQNDSPDLSTIDMEKLKAARELLYDETPDTDRT